MFSRAAKSIVKTIGQRKYHAGEENIKVTLMGGTSEIGRSLSQMLKQTSKLNGLALYDAAALNKRFPVRFHTFSDLEPQKPINSWMLTMLENSRIMPRRQTMREPVAYLTNGPSNIPKNETDELVEVLRRLPVAEAGIDEPLSKSTMIASQGDNACFGHGIPRGPRVLGEMGPDKAQQGGRIVTEIYKQLPDLGDRLGRDCTKRGNRPALRQLSTFTMSTGKASFEDELDRNADEIPGTKTTEAFNKRKTKETKRFNTAAVASIASRSPLKDIDDRTDRRKTRPRKLVEHKVHPEGSSKSVKRGSNAKSRNWTIPAALSDKKPKLLYGLVQQRRTPITWFFSSLFENQKSDVFNDFQSVRQQSRMRKFDSVRERVDPSMKIAGGDRQEISTSVTSLVDESDGKLVVSEPEAMIEDAEEPSEMIDASSMQDLHETRQKVASSSSNETISELSESPLPLRSISSKLWQFLENLRTGRRKSSSLSSLTSYHLDSLFEEAAPIYSRMGGARFFSKNDRPKSSFRDKLKNFSLRKSNSGNPAKPSNPGKSNNPCKKTEQKKGSSCASGDGDTCKLPEKLYGAPCKKMEPECGKKDNCKQSRNEELYGANCKGEDPCSRNEKLYGQTCKEYQDEFGSDDPLDMFWEDKLYGKRCKTNKKSNVCGNPKCGGSNNDPCGKSKSGPCGKPSKPAPCGKKSDTCGKKPDSCGKKKSNPCGNYPDPCGKKKSDTCGKKPDSCGKKKSNPCGNYPDPCGKKKSDSSIKKPDTCGKKKSNACGNYPDPCGKKKSDTCGKKPDSCGKKKSNACGNYPDPCGKKKSDSSIKKPDTCGKKKSNACGNYPDPCGKKKSDTCGKKPDSCGKKKSNACGNYPDPCGKKKSDSSIKKPDTCGKKKSNACGNYPDPCGKKKSDTCGKKPDSCGKKKSNACGNYPDPCGKKKSDSSIKKPDSCGKKKSNACGNYPDPCGKKKSDASVKKPDSCGKKCDPGGKKPEPCGKQKPETCGKQKPEPCGKQPAAAEKKKSTKKEKKDCPPVFRAPGCPQDDKKGGDGKCNNPRRKYSTYSRIYIRSSFFSNQDVLHGFPRIIDRFSMPELCPRIESRKSLRPFNSSIVDS